MKSNCFASSLVALAFVAALGSPLSACKSRPRGTASAPSASAPSATAAGSGLAPLGSATAAAVGLGKDPCAQAADRCTCAATRGAELLLSCFAERALQLLSRAPASCTAPALLAVRAEALAALERGDDAKKLAEVVVQSDPKNRFARRALAIAALQAHDFAASDNALTALVAEDPKDVDSLYYLALSQRRRDHYNGAREGFLHVLRLDSRHIDARYNLVTLTAAAGATQEAEHDYQELEQITPVGDPRLIAARAALRGADKAPAQDLPVLHRAAPEPSIAPPH